MSTTDDITPLPGTYPPAPKAPLAPAVHDGMAVASLVLSLLWLWGFGSLLAVIFAASSNTAAKRAGRQGSGMATAGMVIGIIGLLGAVIITIAVIAAASHAGTAVPCDLSNPNYPYC